MKPIHTVTHYWSLKIETQAK